MGWNPRFVFYAWSQGNSPAKQLEIDKERNPGGCMVGFVFWNEGKWNEFHRLFHPKESRDFVVLNYGTEYDEWLKSQVLEPL